MSNEPKPCPTCGCLAVGTIQSVRDRILLGRFDKLSQVAAELTALIERENSQVSKQEPTT